MPNPRAGTKGCGLRTKYVRENTIPQFSRISLSVGFASSRREHRAVHVSHASVTSKRNAVHVSHRRNLHSFPQCSSFHPAT